MPLLSGADSYAEAVKQLKAGERPDPRIMRPETSDVLIQAYKD